MPILLYLKPVFTLLGTRSPCLKTQALSNTVSLERQKYLYDKTIVPAVYKTISDPA